MDLVSYLGKYVYITLKDGYYYTGRVLEADEQSLTLLDKTQKHVSISKEAISTIREVSR